MRIMITVRRSTINPQLEQGLGQGKGLVVSDLVPEIIRNHAELLSNVLFDGGDLSNLEDLAVGKLFVQNRDGAVRELGFEFRGPCPERDQVVFPVDVGCAQQGTGGESPAMDLVGEKRK